MHVCQIWSGLVGIWPSYFQKIAVLDPQSHYSICWSLQTCFHSTITVRHWVIECTYHRHHHHHHHQLLYSFSKCQNNTSTALGVGNFSRATQGPKFKIPLPRSCPQTRRTCKPSFIDVGHSAQRSRSLRILKTLTPHGRTDIWPRVARLLTRPAGRVGSGRIRSEYLQERAGRVEFKNCAN